MINNYKLKSFSVLRLLSLNLENYRRYRGHVEIDFNDTSVLIGPNNFGKSNVIRALLWYRNMMNGEMSVGNLVYSGDRANRLIFRIKIQFDDRERERLMGLTGHSSYDMIETLRRSNLFRSLMHQVVFDSEGFLQMEDFWVSNYDDNTWLPICGHSQYVHTIKDSTVDFYIGNDLQSNLSKMQRPGQVPSDRIRVGTVRALRRAFSWSTMPRIEATMESMLKTYLSRWFWIPARRHADTKIDPMQTSTGDPSGSDIVRVLFTISGENRDEFDTLTNEINKIIPEMNHIAVAPRKEDITARHT